MQRRHGSIQRNGVSALKHENLFQPTNVLLQTFDALPQLLLKGVINLIELLAAAVHHLGVGQRPGLDRSGPHQVEGLGFGR